MRHTATEVVNAIEDFINMTRVSKLDPTYAADKELSKQHLVDCFVRAWTVVGEKIVQEHEASKANEKLNDKTPPRGSTGCG